MKRLPHLVAGIIAIALISSLIVIAQEKKDDPKPAEKPASYTMTEQDAADYASLVKDAESARQSLIAAVNKVLSVEFESTKVLEAVGQFRDVNLKSVSAQQRLEQWFLSKRPAECQECRISTDGKRWERPKQ